MSIYHKSLTTLPLHKTKKLKLLKATKHTTRIELKMLNTVPSSRLVVHKYITKLITNTLSINWNSIIETLIK